MSAQELGRTDVPNATVLDSLRSIDGSGFGDDEVIFVDVFILRAKSAEILLKVTQINKPTVSGPVVNRIGNC